jgi:hypothetical protein
MEVLFFSIFSIFGLRIYLFLIKINFDELYYKWEKTKKNSFVIFDSEKQKIKIEKS